MSARLTPKQAKALGIDLPKSGRMRDRKAKEPGLGRNLQFEAMCQAHGLPQPISEYRFAPPRQWRFDFIFEGWLALEIEGNPWASINGEISRHFHGPGIINDMEKYNEAAILGYVVLRCTWEQVEKGSAFALVKRALEEGE